MKRAINALFYFPEKPTYTSEWESNDYYAPFGNKLAKAIDKRISLCYNERVFNIR